METKDEQQVEELQTIPELLDQILKPGTVLVYPGEKITFNQPLSAVKSLEVNICSIQSIDEVLLHQLYSNVRKYDATSQQQDIS